MDKTATQQQPFSALVIDDAALYRSYARNILEEAGYSVYLADSGEQALELLKTICPNVILLDIIMNGIDGYETFEHILANPQTSQIPVIFLTAETEAKNELKGFQMGASDYISKPFVPEIMLKRMERVIQLSLLQKDLQHQVQQKSQQLEQISLQAISTIAATIDAKDRYTKGHSERVAKISVEIARLLGFNQDKLTELHNIALLHDIGKIGVPDLILNKPTKLTEEEYTVIKSHTEIGSHILKDISVIPNICDGARWHHERYDGKGYPDGLSGSDIPLTARIIGIADAYDAMSSKRPYRNGLSKERIVDEMIKGRGSQFDPTLTDLMLKLIENGIDPHEETEVVAVKGDFASESNALLYHVYNRGVQESCQSIALDSLTQTYTKRYLELEIKERLEDPNAEGYLLIVDINSFHTVNETYGHVIGDNLLIILSDILRLNVGENDMVGRMDADQFAVFLNHYPSERQLKKLIKEFVARFDEEKTVLDYQNLSSLSFGISHFSTKEEECTFDQLYLQAHAALYSAKQKKHVSFCFYQDMLNKTKTTATKKLSGNIKKLEDYITARNNGTPATDKLSEYEISYQIIHQLSKQKHTHADTLLLSLTSSSSFDDDAEFQTGMSHLKNAIKLSLRHGDFDMQFGSNEYLLILTNVNEEQCVSIVNRISTYFKNLSKSQNLELIYTYHRLF